MKDELIELGLSEEQATAFELMLRGRSNKQIQAELGISNNAVSSRLSRSYQTLGLRTVRDPRTVARRRWNSLWGTVLCHKMSDKVSP